jgi:hypothetical protein
MTSDPDAPTVVIDGKPLPRSDTVTIVGFDFNVEGIDIQSTQTRASETTSTAYAKAKALGMTPATMHPKNIKHVFQAFVASTLTHTTHIAGLYLDTKALHPEYIKTHNQIDDLFKKFRTENPKSNLPKWSDIVWNRGLANKEFFSKTAKFHPIRRLRHIRPEKYQLFNIKLLTPPS